MVVCGARSLRIFPVFQSGTLVCREIKVFKICAIIVDICVVSGCVGCVSEAGGGGIPVRSRSGYCCQCGE